jgi:heterotetrameric sarcosine oxidase beta subunit
MKSSADVVIVGGGVIGCSIAYNLAKRGYQNVVLLEKNFLTSGSTGRSGRGVRLQFGLEMNVKLAGQSISQFEKLSDELGTDINFIQDGYLMLSYDDHTARQLEKNVQLERSLGYDVKLLSSSEAKEIAPALDISRIVNASFHQRDGHVDPYKLTYGYAEAAQRSGVEINTFTKVTGINKTGNRIVSVETTQGSIQTNQVVNAAGAFSRDVSEMAGLTIPTYNEKHEILLSEPMDRFISTMLVNVTDGVCVQQFPNGRVMIETCVDREKTYSLEPNPKFAEQAVKAGSNIVPRVNSLRMTEQWTGLYNMTPDGRPILGGVDEVEGFYLAVGLCGIGLMLSPITGILMAEYIIDSTMPHTQIRKLDYKRFERGELLMEPTVV